MVSSDGLVGAVICDGEYIVTSPKANTIFNPPLGSDRSLFLRTNLCFGDDDPLQWPQPWVPEYPHLPCISLVPRQTEPFPVMWMPDRHDFVEDRGILTGIGKLNPSRFFGLQLLCIPLRERAVQSKFSKELLVSQLIVTLENLLHRLEFISTNFRQMQLTVRETQRIFVELTALLDYYDYFRPVLLLNEPSTPTRKYPPTTVRVMGVFTTDLTVCDAFFRAGIPVWLVRPFSALSSMRVKALARVQTPGDLTPLDPATRPSHPTIYCGSGDHIDKYRAIARHVQHYLQYPNPFRSIRAETSIVPPPREESSKREARRQLYSPCRFLL